MANEGEKKAMVTGFFGEYGGQFIPEALKKRLDDLDAAFRDAMADEAFHEEYLELLRNYVGRPSALTECRNISKDLGGGRLFLKREDLNHGGAHKINNCIGQILLARRMGAKRIIDYRDSIYFDFRIVRECAIYHYNFLPIQRQKRKHRL